jgi:hypothetical protein
LQQFLECGQSQWLDNLTRGMGCSGELARRVSEHRRRGDAGRVQQQLNGGIQSTLAREATDVR